MSLFKKMKLVPFESKPEKEVTSLRTDVTQSVHTSDNIVKNSAIISRDERIINIIDSNLDSLTKLEILKKIFENNLQVQKEIVNQKRKPIVISRKLLTPKSNKLTQRNKKKKLDFCDIPWKQF